MEEVFLALADGNYAVGWLTKGQITFTNIHGEAWWTHEVAAWMYPKKSRIPAPPSSFIHSGNPLRESGGISEKLTFKFLAKTWSFWISSFFSLLNKIPNALS